MNSNACIVQISQHPARWWVTGADSRCECLLCPHHCRLAEGQLGFCRVRQRIDDQIVLRGYGRTSSLQVDPVEKKPLYHFLPGSKVLSFGSVGCNLGCSFCQNWRLSRAEEFDGDSEDATPEAVAATAWSEGCRSVAFTYNDPVVFAEYALDVARACHARRLKTVAVTAGYISATARGEFFSGMDAANVDLKAFSEDFYQRLCQAHLQPVLDTLMYLRRETKVWLEVTTLLIPGENDSREELTRAAAWFHDKLGSDVPWHFSAFHPDYRMMDHFRTPLDTLTMAREIALRQGIRHVYIGNLHHAEGSCTRCSCCGKPLIEREGFSVLGNRLVGDCCPSCKAVLPGVFS